MSTYISSEEYDLLTSLLKKRARLRKPRLNGTLEEKLKSLQVYNDKRDKLNKEIAAIS